MRYLLHYIKEYKRECILSLILVIIETACELFLTLITGSFIDELTREGATTESLITYGLVMFALAVVLVVVGFACGWLSIRAAAGFAKNLRNGMYDHIQDFSFENINRFSAESLITRLTTDVNNIQGAFFMILRIALKSPITLIGGLVLAFTVSWKMGLIYTLSIPVLSVGVFFIAKKAIPYFPKVFRLYDKLNNVVRENVSGIRVVKTFVREEHESKKFLSVSEDLRQNYTKAECTFALNSPLSQLILYICITVITALAAGLIVSSANGTILGVEGMTTGQLQNLFAYGFMILSALMMLSSSFVMIMLSQASNQRIKEVLVEKVDLKSPENALTEVENGDIDFDHVDFSYTGDCNYSLSGIDLHIKSGETVGIIGSTGAAKTSLVQLIPRLYDVTNGSIRVGGHDVKEYDLDVLRNNVAVVLQKNVLFSGTIKENLRWGKQDATDEEMQHVCRLAQADEFIQSFPDGYDTYIEQGGTNVSGGQKQRLCIARALLKKPKILILDDSTSAVDTKTDALIQQAFKNEIPNTTKIIIAQRVSSVQNADKIIVMNEGRIDAIGQHDDLLRTNNIYREVYESQQKGEAE